MILGMTAPSSRSSLLSHEREIGLSPFTSFPLILILLLALTVAPALAELSIYIFNHPYHGPVRTQGGKLYTRLQEISTATKVKAEVRPEGVAVYSQTGQTTLLTDCLNLADGVYVPLKEFVEAAGMEWVYQKDTQILDVLKGRAAEVRGEIDRLKQEAATRDQDRQRRSTLQIAPRVEVLDLPWTIGGESTIMHCLVHYPRNYANGGYYTLMFVLSGSDSLNCWSNITDGKDIILVGVNGLPGLVGGYRGNLSGTTDFFESLIKRLRAQAKIPEIYATGMSASAYMVYDLILDRQGLFDGGIPIAAPLLPEQASRLSGAKGKRFYIIFGTKDHPGGVEQINTTTHLLEANGAKVYLNLIEGRGHEMAHPDELAEALDKILLYKPH